MNKNAVQVHLPLLQSFSAITGVSESGTLAMQSQPIGSLLLLQTQLERSGRYICCYMCAHVQGRGYVCTWGVVQRKGVRKDDRPTHELSTAF